MSDDNEEKFLAELSNLSRKYGIVIAGCGCCNSPFLEELSELRKDGKYIYDHMITWQEKEDE